METEGKAGDQERVEEIQQQEANLLKTVEQFLLRIKLMDKRMGGLEKALYEHHKEILTELQKITVMCAGARTSRETRRQRDPEDGQEREEQKGGENSEKEKGGKEWKSEGDVTGTDKEAKRPRNRWAFWKAAKQRWLKKKTSGAEEEEERTRDEGKGDGEEQKETGEGMSGREEKPSKDQGKKGASEGAREKEDGTETENEKGKKEQRKRWGFWCSAKKRTQTKTTGRAEERVKGTRDEKKGQNKREDGLVAAFIQKQTPEVVDVNVVSGRRSKIMQYLEARRRQGQAVTRKSV